MDAMRRMLWGLVVVAVLAALAQPGGAQGPGRVLINYPEVTAAETQVQVGLYFTLTDMAGQVLPAARIQSATILLEDGSIYPATVEQPTTPFYIALVLDASGSMGSAAQAMRDAAIQAVNNAPQEARFAVIRFNDQIDRLQDFTEDRSQVTNAIGQVQPRNLAGTCLYDAAYEAVTMLSTAPQGRRAIILFTDGRDETAQGTICSRHTYGEVVEFANRADSRAPIHTIGLAGGQAINAAELRNLASSTGGLSAIGEREDLSAMFGQIMTALKSQYLASALTCPRAGAHTATLTVTLEDGSMPQPAAVGFQVAQDCVPPITPTPTATPIDIALAIDAVTVDVPNDLIYVEVAVRGEQLIAEYRFDFYDANLNTLVDTYRLPAPLTSPVPIPAAKLNGELRLTLRATNGAGDAITWPDERGEAIDRAEYEFSFIRPTPTPLPLTPTARPVTVELNSIAYNPETDLITLDLSIQNREAVGQLEINLLNADTNLRENQYYVDPADTVDLSARGLEPGQEYIARVIAQSLAGENLSRSNDQKFLYTPLLTPTPRPTVTPTLTPTLRPVTVSIGSISLDEAAGQIVVGVLTEDQDRIDHYELQIRNADTGLVVGNYVHQPPPYDEVRVPLADLAGAEYSALLRAFGPGGALLVEAAPLEFAYAPPATPTPIPTATPSPTPTPTPTPGFFQRVPDAVGDNPILAAIVAVIGLGLIGLLVLMLRQRRSPETGTAFLADQTGVYQMSAPGAAERRPVIRPAGPPDDFERTEIYAPAPPSASLRVLRSPAAARLGPAVALTPVPFTIGRGANSDSQLNLEEDSGVSRRHARIAYEGGAYTITDLGSSNGTLLDGQRLAPNTPTPLHPGARIVLGKNTEVEFSLSGGREAEDLGKTEYYGGAD